MKCRAIIAAIVSLFSIQLAKAESTKTVFNPYTGKFDYITKVTSTTLYTDAGLSASQCVATDGNSHVISQSCGGGGGSSSLETMVNKVRISSPTGTLDAVAGAGIAIQGSVPAGTTAQLLISLDPNATNYVQNATTLQSATFFVSSGTSRNFNVPVAQKWGTGSNEYRASIGFSNLTFDAALNNGYQFNSNSVDLMNLNPTYDLIGVPLLFPEQAVPGQFSSGNDFVWGDSTAHWVMMENNAGSENYALSGSSTTNTAGHMATWSTNGKSLVDGGAPSAGGGITALTGDVTASGSGSVPATLAAMQSNMRTVTSSLTVTGSGGEGITYNLNIGSMTGAGLSGCSGAGNAVTWNSGTALFGCASGYLTGNQTITVSGDSTGSGTTAITLTAAAQQNNIITMNGSSTTFVNIIKSTSIYQAGGVLYSNEVASGTTGTALTIDWTQGNVQTSTATGNVTFTFVAPTTVAGAVAMLHLGIFTGSGSFTAAWPSTVHWPGGVTPVLTTTGTKMDWFDCRYRQINGNYYCDFDQNYTP